MCYISSRVEKPIYLSKCFILVTAIVDLESIPRHLGTRQEYTLNTSQIHALLA